jgi:tetratricopeptide (TPR) repeat protein
MKSFYLIPEKYLVIGIQVIVGLIFLVPLVTAADFYFPFIVPRNIMFRLLIELLLFVYVILVLQNRKYLPRQHLAWKLLLLFIGLMTFASFLGGNLLGSFWSSYERMEGLVTLYHLTAFFFVIYGTLRKKIQWEQLMQVSLFIALAVGLVGLSQLLSVNLLLESSGGTRITSTLGNATYLAAYMLIHLFISAYFLLKLKESTDFSIYKYAFIVLDVIILVFHIKFRSAVGSSFLGQIFSHSGIWLPFLGLQVIALSHFWYKKNKSVIRSLAYLFYGAISILFLLIISTTQTRGALVGLAISILLAAVLLAVRKGEDIRVKVTSAALVMLLIVSVTVIMLNRDSKFVTSQPVLNKIASISLDDRTTQTRLLTWQAGLKGLRDKPIFGWGVENFPQVFNKYFPIGIYEDEGTPLWFDRPHNILVQYASEGGILALSSYLIFLAYLVAQLLKKKQNFRLGILMVAFLAAYLGQNLFVFDSINSYIPFYFLLGFIIFLLTSSTEKETRQSAVAQKRTAGFIIAGVALVLIGSSAWGLNAKTIKNNRIFVSSFRHHLADKSVIPVDAADSIFNVFASSAFLGKNEILGVYSEHLVELIQAGEVAREELSAAVDRLTKAMESATALQPDDARYGMYLMNLYLNSSSLHPAYVDRLLELAEKVRQLSPDRPQIYYLTGRAHMIKGEYDKGLADFIFATELAPDIFDAHWNLFAAYATIGDVELANQEIQRLKEIKSFSPQRYVRAASVFSSANNIPAGINILEESVQIFPENIDLHATLAEFYAMAGQNEGARVQAQIVLDLEPSAAADVEDFLRRLNAGELRRNFTIEFTVQVICLI